MRGSDCWVKGEGSGWVKDNKVGSDCWIEDENVRQSGGCGSQAGWGMRGKVGFRMRGLGWVSERVRLLGKK